MGLWDREGRVPRRMYFGRGVWKNPPYVFLGGTLPKEDGRTAGAPSLAAARLVWMPLFFLVILVIERRGREKVEGDGSAI